MQKWISFVIGVGLVGLSVIGLTGCGNTDKPAGSVSLAEVSPSSLTLKPGERAKVTVKINREGYDGDVKVQFDYKRPVFVDEVARSIGKGKNSAEYTVVVEKDAAPTEAGTPEVIEVSVRRDDVKKIELTPKKKKITITITGEPKNKWKEERKKYLEPKEKLLSDLQAEIDELTKAIPKSLTEAKEIREAFAALNEAEGKRKAAQAELTKVGEAGEDAWKGLQEPANKAIEAAQTAVTEFRKKYKMEKK